MDIKIKLRVSETPVSVLYISSVLFWHFELCLCHEGEVSAAFHCPGLTIEKYVEQIDFASSTTNDCVLNAKCMCTVLYSFLRPEKKKKKTRENAG